jgi:hypothetical protein
VVGTLAGALLGGAIGHFGYDQERTREQTAKDYSYKESQGTVLRIENLKATPATVRPGETVDLKMTYAVLHDSPNTKVAVNEIREITFKGDLVGRPEVKVEHADGTYTTSVPLQVPPGAEGNVQGQGHGGIANAKMRGRSRSRSDENEPGGGSLLTGNAS